jgi:hypothetical protein
MGNNAGVGALRLCKKRALTRDDARFGEQTV